MNSTGVVSNGTLKDMNIVDLVLDMSDMAADKPQTRRALGPRFGSKIDPGCCSSSTAKTERTRVNRDVTISTSDVEAGLPADAPANRWKQIATPYDNQAHRDQVIRDHEENKKSILHSIDTHIFEKAIDQIIGLTKDEEHDSDTEARNRRRSRPSDFYPPPVNDASTPEVRSSAGGDAHLVPGDTHPEI